MPVERKSYFSLISRDIEQQGHLLVMIDKLTYTDGVLTGRAGHQIDLWPGDDLDQIFALNSADLMTQGFPAISPEDIADIGVIAGRLWTEEIVAAHLERKAQLQAEAAARDAAAAAEAARKLPKWKFWAVLDIAGKAQLLRDAVAQIADPLQRAIVSARLEHTEIYDRDDPLFADEQLMAAIGVSAEDIDALWAQAVALPG